MGRYYYLYRNHLTNKVYHETFLTKKKACEKCGFTDEYVGKVLCTPKELSELLAEYNQPV